MVEQHYRWDFVGLSTDTKPTPETSEKVVDGSTFYCSDTSKLYVYCKDNWYERKALGGGGGGTSYTAGTGIDITDDTISVDTTTIQEKLTAGTGIDITDNTISATGGGGGGITELTSSDYNYPSDSPTSIGAWLLDDGIYSTKSAGVKFDAYMNPVYSTSFIVVTDSADNKYAIIFNSAEGGYIRQTGVNASNNRILTDKNLKSSTGTSTTDVMSQNAVTNAINSIAIKNAGAPTTATVGTVGQLLEDTTNGKLYQCTAVDNTDPNAPSYTWTEVGAGGGGVTVVQTTGNSQTDVMSQDATTSMIYADPTIRNRIKIGNNAYTSIGDDAIELGHEARASQNGGISIGSNSTTNASAGVALGQSSTANGDNATAIGYSSWASGAKSIALGRGASASHSFGVALGAGATTSTAGEINVGTGSIYTTSGYNSSNYRLLSGLYDGQNAHDAVTVEQVNDTIDAINTALSTNIPHIGAIS